MQDPKARNTWNPYDDITEINSATYLRFRTLERVVPHLGGCTRS